MSRAKELIDVLEAQLDEKQGQSTGKEGKGGADVCVCPECGYEAEHKKGTPCNEINCPTCNVPMTGKGAPGDKSKEGGDEEPPDRYAAFDTSKKSNKGQEEK